MTNKPQGPGPASANIIDIGEARSVDTQASEWLAKLDAEAPGSDVRREFNRWIQEDPSHRQAFEAMVAFYDDMNVLTQAVLPRELQADNPAPVTPHSTQAGGWWQAPRLAACAVVLAMAVWFVPGLLPQDKLYITQIGEQRPLQLADGSRVLLNTNSRLRVDYSRGIRRLDLLQGEAHFEVEHDPARPFEVHTGKGLVRAVGTAFTVHIQPRGVEVLVTDGVIELDQAEPPTTQVASAAPNRASAVGLQVPAGKVVVYEQEALAQLSLTKVELMEEQVAWQKGLLVFNNRHLSEVVAEVSRYTSLKIVIPERAMRELKVGGLFAVGDTESLFEALRDGFDIHTERVSEDVVYLVSSENR